MKFLALSLLVSTLGTAAQLKDVKAVYLYPMPGGFDQLLATQLVRDHVYTVVSDPKLADAIFTDTVSDAFLYKLDHINTPPPPANTSGSAASMSAYTQVPRDSTFSRGKGTLFLVDAKSKQVVWSIYAKPKNTLSTELNKTAKKVVTKLEIDNGMKAPH